MRVAIVIGIILLFLAWTSGSAQKTSSQSAPRKRTSSESVLGSLAAGDYRNSLFGFRYKVPYGWVDRTEQMRETSGGSDKSLVLLAAFGRPPEASGETVNSAVIITAESLSLYPQVKTAADYFASVTDAATKRDFKPAGEPYWYQLGTKRLVRGDFTNEVGGHAMYQSSLVTLDKGYAISFTFLEENEGEVEQLMQRLAWPGQPKK
ncbi:MAG TPA: hypothetical protein VFI95_09695 [Terriglobales bacterium]|nr:hypothetical protein [Terriglobales bacterium]